MSDRRDEILNSKHNLALASNGVLLQYPEDFPKPYQAAAKNAMDEYFTERALELLQFMAANDVEISTSNEVAELTGEQVFYYQGEWITKEQLFEIFL